MSAESPRQQSRNRWPLRIFLPCAATVILFVVAIYVLVRPTLERSILDRKKEMIRRLTESAWSVMAYHHRLAVAGELTDAQAKAEAVARIRRMHYGPEMKDYFWINDMHPRMIMHPYRSDLDGQDLSDFTDPEGKRLFVACVDTVRRAGEGYVDYMWQWKDDHRRIVPKLSYVKGFAPWNWVVGTGVYIEDVRAEIAGLTRQLFLLSSAVFAVVSVLAGVIVVQGAQTDKRRRQAELALRDSEHRLQTMLNAIQAGILVVDAKTRRILDANPAYETQPLYDEAVRRYAPFKGESALEVIRETKRVIEIVAVLGGQWPHSSYIVPGGVVTIPNGADLIQCRHLLAAYRRWYERRILGCRIERWLEEIIPDGTFYVPVPEITAGQGYGATEAARGALGHWVRIEDGLIHHYQIITPTAWNGSPRDDHGVRSPWEEALLDTPVRDPANPVEIGHVVRSFDPCLVCAVHAIRGPGRVTRTTLWPPASSES